MSMYYIFNEIWTVHEIFFSDLILNSMEQLIKSQSNIKIKNDICNILREFLDAL